MRTQEQLDSALADPLISTIFINSPKGVCLYLGAFDSATVEAYGSATVEAYGSATVRAYGSATVRAFDSATVEASGSATVRASDSATVRAFDSATVEAYGSATVRASDSATVRASGSATVHVHSADAIVDGRTVIDLTTIDLSQPSIWADYHGVSVTGGIATLYKAVDPNLMTGHEYGSTTTWKIGETVIAPDWDPEAVCGRGLHLSPTPGQARRFRPLAEVTRYLRVQVNIDDLVPLGDEKCKVRQALVVNEVDSFGRDLEDTI